MGYNEVKIALKKLTKIVFVFQNQNFVVGR